MNNSSINSTYKRMAVYKEKRDLIEQFINSKVNANFVYLNFMIKAIEFMFLVFFFTFVCT